MNLMFVFDMQMLFYYISDGYEYKTDAELKEFDEEENERLRSSYNSLTRLSLNAPP